MPDSAALLREGVRAEMLGLADRALEAYRAVVDGTEDPDLCAEAWWRQADVLRVQCAWGPALAAARRAQSVARDARLPLRLAEAVNAEASVHLSRGEFAEARALLEPLVASLDDPRLRGIALQNLGATLAQQSDLDAAERAFAESHACFEACGYERGQAIALNNQGRVRIDRGDHAGALLVLERAERAARRVEDEELIALALTNLAEAALAIGDEPRAYDLACTALGHFRASGNRWREIECLRLLGILNARRGAPDEARRCWERGLRLAEAIGSRPDVDALGALLAGLGE